MAQRITIMKILIIKFRNIGDALLPTPLIENLKLNYPNSQIDYALNSNCSEMIRLNPNINNLYQYYRDKIKNQNFISKAISEIKYINCIIKNSYNIVINLTEGDRGSLITFFSKARVKLGYKPRKGVLKFMEIYTKLGTEKQNLHSVEKDLQFIKLLDKSIINKKVSNYWSKKDEEKISKILTGNSISAFIHIHPVSRWMFKCWEDDKMAEIIDYCENVGNIRVIITASNEKKERDRVKHIISLCKSSPIDLTGQLTLKELACLSSRAKLFFGIDSAPMHIAASVDTPVVALFGASMPNVWGPWDNALEKTEFKLTDGTQKSGKHLIISDKNHTIYHKNGIKKCRGMSNIPIPILQNLLDKYLNK